MDLMQLRTLCSRLICRETMIIHYLEFAAKVKSERNGTAKHQKRSPAIIYGVVLAIIEDFPRGVQSMSQVMHSTVCPHAMFKSSLVTTCVHEFQSLYHCTIYNRAG